MSKIGANIRYLVRPRGMLRAFQWDGEEVEGFQRIAVGRDELNNQQYNLVAALLDQYDLPSETFAVPGDWIITNNRGSFVWPQQEFDETYEILMPLDADDS